MSRRAYMAYAKIVNFQPGDIVGVRFEVPDYAGGWNNFWAPKMGKYVGSQFTVLREEHGHGVLVRIENSANCLFPVFCLFLIRRAKTSEEKAEILMGQSTENKEKAPSEKEKQRNWARAIKNAEVKSKSRKSNLMTIEIEELREERVNVISIKNAKSREDFPQGYADNAAPSFTVNTAMKTKQLYSLVLGDKREKSLFPTNRVILVEGHEYSKEQFRKALRFLKTAGDRFTRLKKKEREAAKPKRRTIII